MLRGGARGLNPDNPLAVEANYAGGGDVLDVEFFNVVSSLPPEIIKELKSCKDFTLYLQCYLNMDLGRAREVVAEISKMGMGHYIIQGYIKEYEIES